MTKRSLLAANAKIQNLPLPVPVNPPLPSSFISFTSNNPKTPTVMSNEYSILSDPGKTYKVTSDSQKSQIVYQIISAADGSQILQPVSNNIQVLPTAIASQQLKVNGPPPKKQKINSLPLLTNKDTENDNFVESNPVLENFKDLSPGNFQDTILTDLTEEKLVDGDDNFLEGDDDDNVEDELEVVQQEEERDDQVTDDERHGVPIEQVFQPRLQPRQNQAGHGPNCCTKCRAEIKLELREILLLLRNGNHGAPAPGGNRPPPTFVLEKCQTVRDLTRLNETLLDNDQNQVGFQEKISSFGGESLQKVVSAALNAVMNNTVAHEITWTGQGNTVGLGNLKIGELITVGVKQKYPQETDYTIQKHIKNWLRRAGDRIKAARGGGGAA